MQSRGLTLNQLVEGFLNDPRRRGVSEKRRIDYEMVFRILREVWGGQKRVRDLVREDFREVSRLIRAIPKHSTKIFPGIAFAEAARRAEENELPKLNPKTVASHLQKVSTLFRWAEDEDYVERNLARGLADPGAGTHSEDDRHPFSIEELQKIFSAPLFSGCIDDQRNHARPGPNRPKRARFWVPLIGLFHGMRLNEICQLRVDQLCHEGGIWFFDVRAADVGQRLKTQQSRRRVPVHPILGRAGIVEYAVRLRDDGQSRLFPELSMDSRGYYSRKLTRWFPRFLLSCGVQSERKSFHSFRHNWRDAARAAKISSEVAEAIGGWGRKNTAAKYGSGYSLRFLQGEISKIEYALDISHLYDPTGHS